MKLIIAEKPSVAKDIATSIGASSKNNGYFQGNNYYVTWAYGHLFSLANPSAYGFKEWNLHDLPIIPKQFKTQLLDDKGVKSQFKIINTLASSSNEIIAATDAGREGELIFRLIYQNLSSKPPIKRLWISSLTPEAIKKGFDNLFNGKDFDPLYHSALCRSHADWIVGINATRCLTINSYSSAQTVLSLGRVQTPVLAMIVSRFIDNKSFQSKTFFEPTLTLQHDGIQFKATFITENHILDQAKAQAVLNQLNNKQIQCTLSNIADKIDKQPLLYDLNTLQAVANSVNGLTAQQSLDIAQFLYENKFITYPRTDSRYISKDILNTVPDLLNILSSFNEDYKKHIDQIKDPLPSGCVNDNKITDHHAIIPTGIKPTNLNDKQQFIYQLIAERFIASFSPICTKKSYHYVFNNSFQTKETTIISYGWRGVEQYTNNAENTELPTIKQDQQVDLVKKYIHEGKTKPLPLHSDSSLLKLMASAGKILEDDPEYIQDIPKEIKEKGIGTSATRPSIIETLIKRSYVQRQKNKLIPTKLGLELYNALKDIDISSVAVTGEWEAKLNRIADSRFNPQKFMEEIQDYTHELILKLKQTKISNPDLVSITCPKCNSGKVSSKGKFYGCSNYAKGCDFTLPKVILKKTLRDVDIQQLVKNRSTGMLKGFVSKEGKKFDAYLNLTDELTLKLSFSTPTKFKCPNCQHPIEKDTYYFKCKQCDFKVSQSIKGKKLTDSHIADLIAKGQTAIIKGFTSKAGKSYAARLILEDGHVQFQPQFTRSKK